jgi:carbonic anhydrase
MPSRIDRGTALKPARSRPIHRRETTPMPSPHSPTCRWTLVALTVLLAAGPGVAADHGAPATKPTPPLAKPSTDDKAEPGAKEAPAKVPPAPVVMDTLEQVRERLAAKLGAQKAKDGKTVFVVQSAAQAPGDVRVAAKPVTPRHGAMAGSAERGANGAKHRAAGHGNGHWSYEGEDGPPSWGSMKPEFATCSTGQRQSPIDIREGITVELEPVKFDYRASSFSVIDNGHTVQANLAPGNAIEVLGKRYELLQFHFHRPSEERIGGRQFDMVAHLVHKDADGRLAVVAVLLDRGSVQPIVQTVWNNLPLEKNEAQPARVMLDPSALLPPDRRYYTYMGSLTTPPCSEGVLWMVLKNPVSIAPEQIDIFAKLYPMNARPVQPTAGRLIKQSN